MTASAERWFNERISDERECSEEGRRVVKLGYLDEPIEAADGLNNEKGNP